MHAQKNAKRGVCTPCPKHPLPVLSCCLFLAALAPRQFVLHGLLSRLDLRRVYEALFLETLKGRPAATRASFFKLSGNYTLLTPCACARDFVRFLVAEQKVHL